MPKAKSTKLTDQTKDISQQLFKHLDFEDIKIKVAPAEEDSLKLNLEIDPEKAGILIGHNGETVASLQLLLSLMMAAKLGQWHRLVVNVNDYRERRHDSLVEMAQNAAQKVKATGEQVMLQPMESFDRRIIHLALAEEPEVSTESTGEGRDRRLIIYPSQK